MKDQKRDSKVKKIDILFRKSTEMLSISPQSGIQKRELMTRGSKSSIEDDLFKLERELKDDSIISGQSFEQMSNES